MRVSNNRGSMRISLTEAEVVSLLGTSPWHTQAVWLTAAEALTDEWLFTLSPAQSMTSHEVKVRPEGKGFQIDTTRRCAVLPYFGVMEMEMTHIASNPILVGAPMPTDFVQPRQRATPKLTNIVKYKKPTLAETVQTAHAIAAAANVQPFLDAADAVARVNEYKMALGEKFELKISKDGLLIASMVFGGR